MEIRINGQKADIQLESEKTVGEILSVLEQWLDNSGHRLSGLVIDGRTAGTESLEAFMAAEVISVKTLDIITSSLTDLIAESLFHLLGDIDEYENSDFAEKSGFAERWKDQAAARLLAEQFPDIFVWASKTFSGEGLNPAGLRSLTEERLRELRDPAGEIGRAGPFIAEICTRLEELPLDIQTGKDARAVETVNIFSGAAEMVFRIFNILKLEGFPVEEITVGKIPVTDYIAEFSAALRELLAAYEQHDTVLVGDLAEYEMAPRLRGLHTALRSAGSTDAAWDSAD
ncbi:MAG: hypothetical protein LBD48_02340 [Treponema sp.]|jgi:hypothetical protein|nr:hypothetical protein [Treponema sp.]